MTSWYYLLFHIDDNNLEILHQCKHQFYFIFNTRFLLNEISGANFSLEMCLYIHALNSECIMEGEKKSSHPYKTF